MILSAEQRKGLLVAVITGGRPLLKQRPTAKRLEEVADAGFSGPVWVVSDRHAPGYERDQHEVAVYPHEWAHQYARDHWMNPDPPGPDGFLGAFPGREWASLEAERRGCWGVLQLDDNIMDLRLFKNTSGARLAEKYGGLALYADLLGALSLSTNARMLGAAMTAVQASPREFAQLARPGFPYSCFVERVGEGRESWLGPYEDDITHAFQYGGRWDGATAALTPSLTYIKENRSRTGMRAKYDHTRAVQLQRLIPQGADVALRARRANGMGTPRVFHAMRPGAIRNPLRVKDAETFGQVRDRVQRLMTEWLRSELEANKAKVRGRTRRFAARQGGLSG